MAQHTAIQLFNNDEFELSFEHVDDTFRVYGMLVAKGLAYRDASALARTLPGHCKDFVTDQGSAGRGVPTLTGARRDQGVWYLTEEGFYRAIGQRVTSRITDPTARAQVERFQSWVFGEVLPAIRKHGRYEVEEPECYAWDHFAQILYQRYGVSLSVPQVTNALRAAGVIGQKGLPLIKYRDWFWVTENRTVNVVNFAVPRVAAKVTETRMKLLERLQWHQMRLELEGVGSDEPPELPVARLRRPTNRLD